MEIERNSLSEYSGCIRSYWLVSSTTTAKSLHFPIPTIFVQFPLINRYSSILTPLRMSNQFWHTILSTPAGFLLQFIDQLFMIDHPTKHATALCCIACLYTTIQYSSNTSIFSTNINTFFNSNVYPITKYQASVGRQVAGSTGSTMCLAVAMGYGYTFSLIIYCGGDQAV